MGRRRMIELGCEIFAALLCGYYALGFAVERLDEYLERRRARRRGGMIR